MSPDGPSPPAVQPDVEPYPGEQNTRLSGAWTAVVIGLIALVLILVSVTLVFVSGLNWRTMVALGLAAMLAAPACCPDESIAVPG